MNEHSYYCVIPYDVNSFVIIIIPFHLDVLLGRNDVTLSIGKQNKTLAKLNQPMEQLLLSNANDI